MNEKHELHQIHGNTEGIRKSQLDQLATLYDFSAPPDICCPPELLDPMAEASARFNREISIYLSRAGKVLDIAIGNQFSVSLADMHQRRNQERLAMVRCIHTHPGGTAELSDVDISALRSLRLDAMVAVSVLEGRPREAQAAFLGELSQGIPLARLTPVIPVAAIPQAEWMAEIRRSEALVRTGEAKTEADVLAKRAILVGMEDEASLLELRRLAETAGFTVLSALLQKRAKPDHATYIGSGKVSELSLLAQGQEANLVVFDDELSGAQTRNLESMLPGVEVIDRTTLILHIFAQRALSYEGRLQVELAQLSYQLPRLAGQGGTMSQQAGSSGSIRARGPGETQLELDRRYIRGRMADLRKAIVEIKKQRDLRRERRQKGEVPVVALVGYTNAGKSTLMNQLAGADALVEDKLFATLDPLTRQVRTTDGKPFLLVDTVGFIHKLPHALVDAFRSTLEEAALADLLLVVSDAASPHRAQERQVVTEVLASLGAAEKPLLEVLNKVDLPHETPLPPGFPISAKDGAGVDALVQEIERQLSALSRTVRLLIPFNEGTVLAGLHASGAVRAEEYLPEGTRVTASVDAATLSRLLHRLGPQALCDWPEEGGEAETTEGINQEIKEGTEP